MLNLLSQFPHSTLCSSPSSSVLFPQDWCTLSLPIICGTNAVNTPNNSAPHETHNTTNTPHVTPSPLPNQDEPTSPPHLIQQKSLIFLPCILPHIRMITHHLPP